MDWVKNPPTIADMNSAGEAFYWARGTPFNRAVMVRVNSGVLLKQKPSDAEKDIPRSFFAETNFMFYTENLPEVIWRHKLPHFGLGSLDWAGPVPLPDK